MYGRQFTIISDHKPLKYILGETRGISPLAQHWALTVSAYSYTICFKLGADNGNADGLNCSPVPNHIKEVSIPGDVLLLFRTLDEFDRYIDHVRLHTPIPEICSSDMSIRAQWFPCLIRLKRTKSRSCE